ncbi:MAG: hypothetical protein ABIA74_04935 [bacterium]
MKKLFIAILIVGTAVPLMNYIKCDTTVTSKGELNDCSKNRGVEYYNLIAQLSEHLSVTSIDQQSDEYANEYITQYLKKIGTPVALQLLNDLIQVEKYIKEGLQLLKNGKNEEAIAIFTFAIEIAPSNCFLWDRRGTANFSLKRYDQALADYTMAINLCPSNGFYYSERALVYMGIGNKNAMVSDITKAAALGEPEAQKILSAWKTNSTPNNRQDLSQEAYKQKLQKEIDDIISARFTRLK